MHLYLVNNYTRPSARAFRLPAGLVSINSSNLPSPRHNNKYKCICRVADNKGGRARAKARTHARVFFSAVRVFLAI